jgi:hypothetical protein
VSIGWYSTPESVSETLRFGVAMCAPGTFCDAGRRTNCTAGKYSLLNGRSTPCDEDCPAGMKWRDSSVELTRVR